MLGNSPHGIGEHYVGLDEQRDIARDVKNRAGWRFPRREHQPGNALLQFRSCPGWVPNENICKFSRLLVEELSYLFLGKPGCLRLRLPFQHAVKLS